MQSDSPFQFDVQFPGGAGVRDTAFGDQALVIPADPPSTERARGYDYYFCVKVTNRAANTVTQRTEARRHDRPAPAWRPARIPLFISRDARTWFVLDGVQADSTHEQFAFDLTLEPSQSVYVSNSLPFPSAAMVRWLRAAAARRPEMTTVERFGTSADGAEMLALTIGARDGRPRDRVLVTSGFHPAEADWLATTTIIDALLGDSEWASRVRANYVVDVVPQVNPDGFDRGLNACNAHGVNLYWDFRLHDEQTAPEAAALWRWVQAHPPALYLDFHAYVHQLHKDFRPYVRPKADYAASARPVARAIDRALIGLCEGRSVLDPSTNDPRTLAAHMTRTFGTVTYPKFHFHLVHGIEAARRLSVDVFRAVVEPAIPFRPLAPRIQPPRDGAVTALVRWLEQGRLPLKTRRGMRKVAVAAGLRTPISSGVRLPPHEGLGDQWRPHLWRDRATAVPAFTIDRAGR